MTRSNSGIVSPCGGQVTFLVANHRNACRRAFIRTQDQGAPRRDTTRIMIGPTQFATSNRFHAARPEEGEAPPAPERAFADWLAEELRARGITVSGLRAEDFGWSVLLRSESYNLRIECGARDQAMTQWAAYVVAQPPLLLRIFRMVETRKQVERLSAALAKVMKSLNAGEEPARER
ncbi:MAG: hypothetical protein IT514_00570 [Burkholderiales bacterium]|nr:hypothetical protein [Burkholderiales bacterium]